MTGAAILDPRATDRIIHLLGMLGSAHDGEVANAGRLADQMIRKAGLTWADVIRPFTDKLPEPEYAPSRREPPRWREPASWREAVRVCIEYPELITDWELNFAESLRNYRTITVKQDAVLWRILDKVRDAVLADGVGA